MVDKKTHEVASLSNMAMYEKLTVYIDGAPHVKHPALRNLYGKLMINVYNFAHTQTSTPNVLDLGAGEGSTTIAFLEAGAKVTAVDISERQLKILKARCVDYAEKLEVRCQDVLNAIKSTQLEGKQYDIIVANSFLHHVPDYLNLISQSIPLLSNYGQFFSFQDPLRYDSVGRFTMLFSTLAYFSWRVFQRDAIGGLKRRLRRRKGVYLDNCPEDNYEYHVNRNGVDQEAIHKLFTKSGFDCEIVRYFSTQSGIWQPIGTVLGIKNYFAIVARKNTDFKGGI